MKLSRRSLTMFVAALSLVTALPAFAANTTTEVSLWDKPDLEMATGLAYGAGGDQAKANMGITLSASTVPSGQVTFNVVNDGPDMIHEMVVSPISTPGKQLPYDNALDKVIEDDAGHLGEVSELDPGQMGGLTLELTPGQYILYCNIPGHYGAGMWAILTVE